MSKLTRIKVFDDGTVAVGDISNPNTIRIIKESSAHHYIALALMGHTCVGGSVPALSPTNAETIEDAKHIVSFRNRVKRNGIIGIWESDFLTCKFVDRVNQLDPLTSKNTKKIKDLDLRTVVLPQAVRYNDPYKNRKNFNPCPQIDEDEVRTADEYRDFDVLQRYTAPIRVNGELQFNRKINFEDMMEEYLYQNTLRYGVKDCSILSLYMQIKGKDNPLQVTYHPENDTITWVHPVGQNTLIVKVNDIVKPWLDAYMEQQAKEEQGPSKEEWTSGKQIQKISTVDRFRQRAEARKRMQESKTKQTPDDVM